MIHFFEWVRLIAKSRTRPHRATAKQAAAAIERLVRRYLAEVR